MAQSANMDASELARDIAAGLASATTATERAALVPAELVEAIQQLKTQRDAVILAHYYVAPEVQAVADFVGDSFYLAKLAKSLPQQTIVLCGVEFMGESAKLLNPTKTVLLPEPGADCPMAHMVKRETVGAARAEYGDDLAVVCYVNSTVEIKSWSDVCVTSSNAVKIVSELPQQHILFIPDQNLGRFVAEQVPQKHVILNNGYCPRHHIITVEQIVDAQEAHPDAARAPARSSTFLRCSPPASTWISSRSKSSCTAWRRARARCRLACRTRPPIRPSSRSTACSSTRRAKPM